MAKAVAAEDRAKGGRQGERVGKTIQPKNRAPAPLQITAEQLLRESLEFTESRSSAPQQSIATAEELREFQLRKRKEFEDGLRRQRHSISQWLRYAEWEGSQKEWGRARSIFERALEVDYRNVSVWMKYAEFEMRHRFIAHARNVFDRAITLHPRVDALWYKYVYMEERLGDVRAVRGLFTRWLTFHPDEKVYYAFIGFELRHRQLDEVRSVYQRFTLAHHFASSYIRYAKFEERQGEVRLARGIYDLALKEIKESAKAEADKREEEEQLLLAYADFEERQREYDRARAIFRYALDRVKRAAVTPLFERYSQFEKQHGDREELETVILAKRRLFYEAQLRANPHSYDVYFDYLQLEQSMPKVNSSSIRALFERGIAAVPKVASKRQWKRYIYLWIYFAVWEELDMAAYERVKALYERLLGLLHPLPFTFAKLWLLYAEFLIRRKDLASARKVFGAALGLVGKASLYVAYMQMEMSLGEVERCRRIFDKWLEEHSTVADVWVKYAEMERHLEERERARRIMELAVGQPALDRPERVWKGYIDMELQWMKRSVEEEGGGEELREEGRERIRRLYERLLERTQHCKVFISYAHFEVGEKEWKRTRAIFQRADDFYANKCREVDDSQEEGAGTNQWQRVRERESVREERALLLSSWREYEAVYGSREQQQRVQAKLPVKVHKKRERRDASGEVLGGWEEVVEYRFPEEEQTQLSKGLKLMERAKLWKAAQERKKREQLERLQRELDAEPQESAHATASSTTPQPSALPLPGVSSSSGNHGDGSAVHPQTSAERVGAVG